MLRGITRASGPRGPGRALPLGLVGALIAVGAVAAAATPRKPLFGDAKVIPLARSSYPLSLATADLNRDGKLDIAVADFAARRRSVSVLLGRGDGRFRPRRDYRLSRRPTSVLILDLNGDGKLDLLTADFSLRTGVFSLLPGRGDGSFEAERRYATGGGGLAAVGDLSGDQRLDVVIGSDSGLAILVGTSDGRFERRPGDLDAGAAFVAIGDLNGDGSSDLATAQPGGVSVFLNRGNATFSPRQDYSSRAAESADIAIADLNGDREPDLATADKDGTVTVFLNKGGGRFGAAKPYNTVDGDEAIAVGDVNGDSKVDIVTANPDCCPPRIGGLHDSISVFTNRGDGTFSRSREYRTYPYSSELSGERPEDVALGDLNRDGKLDVVTANSFGDSVSVLINATGACVVPGVTGRSLPTAKAMIRSNGCRVGTVRRAYSHSVQKGRVVTASPRPGTVLRRGARINLTLSRGRRR